MIEKVKKSDVKVFIAKNWDTYCYGGEFKNDPQAQAELLKIVSDEFMLDYCVEALTDVSGDSYIYPYATYYSKALQHIILVEHIRPQDTVQDLATYALSIQKKCEELENRLALYCN